MKLCLDKMSNRRVTAMRYHSRVIYEVGLDVGATAQQHIPTAFAVLCFEEGCHCMELEATYIYSKADVTKQALSIDLSEKEATSAPLFRVPSATLELAPLLD